MQISDWLARHASYSPDKVAVVEAAAGRRFTYREFNARANRFANFLLEKCGVKRGERVAVLAKNCAEILEIWFACQKLGTILVPLNHRLAPVELDAIARDGAPCVLFYGAEFPAALEALRGEASLRHFVALEEPAAGGDFSYARDIAAASTAPPAAELPDMEDPWLILYTSGTTGLAKGAVLSHRMVTWNAVNTALRDCLPTDITLTHTPLFYTGGLNVYTSPLFFLGGTVVLMRAWNADEALELIEGECITIFFCVPTQFQMLLDTPRFAATDFRFVRLTISGGAPCPPSIIRAFMDRGVVFKQGFGLTEVGPNCFCLEGRDALRKAGSIGFPNFFVQARLVDDAWRDVPRGEVGELLLSTPAMCSGYWNNPELTRATIRDGWFATGDLARQDEEGYFYIVDRKKDMYISGGENVYPAEVERVLLSHEKIADAAVIGVADAKWGEVGLAVVVAKPGEKLNAEEIMAHCRERLAKFKVPKYVEFATDLPRTQTGKTQKQELKQRYGKPSP